MAAGVTKRLWSVEDMVALLPDTVTGKTRGPDKKRAEIAA
jgi:hypothetical protein